MKIFVCLLAIVALASSAAVREKRGFLHGNLHHDLLHHDLHHHDLHHHDLHHSPILHAPLLPHAHLHAPLPYIHHSPILNSHAHIHPVSVFTDHGDHGHLHTGGLLHRAPIVHHAPLLPHKIIRAPIRYGHGW